MSAPIERWDVFVAAFAHAFTQPSSALFEELISAWILCPGRHTVTRMIRMLDPSPRRAHDAYHRFLREGAWSMSALWRLLALALAAALVGPGKALDLDLDDTLFHKTGRKVEGAGNFRDAVRSTKKHVVYALGLNLVVITLRITAPWGGEPLGLPINVRVYRKAGPSHLDLAVEMLWEIAGWFHNRKIHVCADGAYASLARRIPHNYDFASRMRRDAALYKMPPKHKKKKRGRPRKKGQRLPTPEEIARRAKNWISAIVDCRGRSKERLIHVRRVLWYATCPTQQVLLVIVRDPAGKEPDDFFFTTDVEAYGPDIAARYFGRWAIEDTFRNTKQCLGGEDPQTWKGHGPERAACLSLWIYAAVWHWYIKTQGARPAFLQTPWYPGKATPSFADALAVLRRALWRRRIFARSDSRPLPRKFAAMLIGVLAEAT